MADVPEVSERATHESHVKKDREAPGSQDLASSAAETHLGSSGVMEETVGSGGAVRVPEKKATGGILVSDEGDEEDQSPAYLPSRNHASPSPSDPFRNDGYDDERECEEDSAEESDEDEEAADAAQTVEDGFGKEKANEAFKEGRFNDAITQWKRLIRSCDYIISKGAYNEAPEKLAEITTLRHTVRLNLSMGFIKTEQFASALEVLGKVLADDPENVKALYRKADALFRLEEYEEAEKAADAVLEIDKENRAAAQLREKAKREAVAYRQKQKKQVRRIFEKMSEVPDARSCHPWSPEKREVDSPVWFLNKQLVSSMATRVSALVSSARAAASSALGSMFGEGGLCRRRRPRGGGPSPAERGSSVPPPEARGSSAARVTAAPGERGVGGTEPQGEVSFGGGHLE
uniref:peptidylprolyl isomerase n=1 Tax=Chromera velia CCMP2878 TaxID=1169474 RepID=A0A0G4FR70_9ALVE|eukprot:Cvel_18338.t1-p1 / transcript=Cvel_18338.t1 / gene=Cvel_18338 / organism=Chromera_velia_CCMP2878 / gene_product=Peptidyl-prolyl cis-trans isomerase FKBP4, putative / transcript_product=Peptidyl-prolyl cis-trans isomerase FKBP4, putative / location=Cvel_scaffold1514:18614-20318(+) / protein_length=403 / sequence_SO=supercontig / SO=protein_coding / is_pseudo=false